ncbi:acyl-CoA dehydrogenase [Salinisphaera sp. Q1T1-3]|uniref:acyl-CoA dehydrogenase n=1 Tax=Salinisphaera sp. Q1T1-3 TaxID=2321229 RepID=UPI000E738B9F|nr:acyl-CoA dehydrogenase [Salinisphaera sp. Q1T1-3]RJS95307.1 acyl-CoA dehydrogenase [Salinisphaera sp. Q1T1-3]
MSVLLSLIVAVAAVWLMAYKGVSRVTWSAVTVVYFLGLALFGVIGWVGLLIAAIIFGTPIVIFNSASLRKQWVTKRVFAAFKRVLPPMSDTEREALEAGSTWWETEMFRGKPDWSYLLNFQRTQLTAEERSFIDNETDTLCAMLDEWEILNERHDIPPEGWDYIRENKFFAMLIPKAHGGLGFSALAQSTVVAKIASRSLTTAVTVMVPNSLGPGELLVHYGTKAQQDKWLPGLADGSQIPCFGLTGPEVGSDAGALPDYGIVTRGEYNGEEVLGIKLTFSKRWITLAPVATVIGLAFKLHDPDHLLGDENKTEYGITCALISADEPGVEIGKRHFPGAFMNGPIHGTDVFVPLDAIIGGPERAGGGWRMLVECLSAGRGISLPALSSAASKLSYRMTGAWGRIRRQFKLPVGKFEGVQEATARIAGLNYKMEAARILTASAVDECTPSVVTAMAKYHMTEWMRTIVNDAMDVHGGRGIQQGPRNYLSSSYVSVPIAITVEGANILTRSLMIFGQGAIRCHPYVFPEMEAARKNDLDEFDDLLCGHIGFSVNRAARAFTFGLFGSILVEAPVIGEAAPYYRKLERFSSALAICADITMGLLGGELKRKELLSARLGDVLSELYFASATLKYFHDEGEKGEDVDHLHYVMAESLANIEKAFDGFLRNFPNRGAALLMRVLVLPTGRRHRGASDALVNKLGDAIMEPSAFRDRLSADIYLGKNADSATGRMEQTFKKLIEVEPVYDKFFKAVAKGELSGLTTDARLASAVERGILDKSEAEQVRVYDEMRYDAILTDAFTPEYLADMAHSAHVDDRAASRVA